jgi:hypothetical protein
MAADSGYPTMAAMAVQWSAIMTASVSGICPGIRRIRRGFVRGNTSMTGVAQAGFIVLPRTGRSEKQA